MDKACFRDHATVKGFRAEVEGDRLALAWDGVSVSKQEAEVWVRYRRMAASIGTV
jgi:hypothetical protein